MPPSRHFVSCVFMTIARPKKRSQQVVKQWTKMGSIKASNLRTRTPLAKPLGRQRSDPFFSAPHQRQLSKCGYERHKRELGSTVFVLVFANRKSVTTTKKMTSLTKVGHSLVRVSPCPPHPEQLCGNGSSWAVNRWLTKGREQPPSLTRAGRRKRRRKLAGYLASNKLINFVIISKVPTRPRRRMDWSLTNIIFYIMLNTHRSLPNLTTHYYSYILFSLGHTHDQRDVVPFEHNPSNTFPSLTFQIQLLGIVQDEVHELIKPNNLTFDAQIGFIIQPHLDSSLILKKPKNQIDRLGHYLLRARTHYG
mmetsp:Transcript_17548/g.28406  ORF Transcript_17548/g.28406 Transcript_17548/m.28406 type:complete len:307 (-) Transcript_17548:252-1172(-)